MKKQIKEYFEFDASGEFEGSLEVIKSKIEEFQSLGWEGIEKVNDGYGSYYYEYLLYKFREETDEEYEKRLYEEQLKEKLEANKKEKRRQQYEQLKKEFEGE